MGGHPLLLHQLEASLLPLGTPGCEALEGWALKVFFGPGPIGFVIWPPFIPQVGSSGSFTLVSLLRLFLGDEWAKVTSCLDWDSLGDWACLLAGSSWHDIVLGTSV